jgi:FKBP-type peptidyl-prolyl cis-trans isomerase FkpA
MRSPGFLVLVSALALALSGCSSNSSADPGAGFTPTNLTPPRGNFTQVDLVVGSGATANTGNRITVGYSGFLYDPAQADNKGRQFDSNTAFTFTLGAGQVIKGWDQGIVGMRVGGQRRLVIPPELAYGNQAVGATIPANATLVFDVRLISVG